MELKLTEQQADVLDSIRTLGDCSLSDLILDTGRRRQSVTRSVAALARQKLIEPAGRRKGASGPDAQLWRVKGDPKLKTEAA